MQSMFVVGIVQENTNSSVDVMRVEKAPAETYADIGGLDEQILEIKVPPISAIPEIGVRRAPADPPRALRRNRREAAQGSDSVRRAGHRKDASGESRGEQNVCDVSAARGKRVGAEIRGRR